MVLARYAKQTGRAGGRPAASAAGGGRTPGRARKGGGAGAGGWDARGGGGGGGSAAGGGGGGVGDPLADEECGLLRGQDAGGRRHAGSAPAASRTRGAPRREQAPGLARAAARA